MKERLINTFATLAGISLIVLILRPVQPQAKINQQSAVLSECYAASQQEDLLQRCITDVRRMPMSNIKRIIKLNRNRQRAIKEKDFRKFYTFSCKIHLIERMDKVPIGSYILK